MPRPGGRMSVGEKSKDFKGSMIRLFNSLDKWKKMLVFAMVLSLISAILSTIAPSKLSDLTNVVNDGIMPNSIKIEEIYQKIYANLLISTEKNDYESAIMYFNNLSDEEKTYILLDITIDNQIVNAKDQIVFIELKQNISNNSFELGRLDQMPASIKKLVEPKMDMINLRNKAVVLGLIYLFGALFGYLQGFIMAIVSNNFAKKLRTDISKKINKLPLRYFDAHETGDILSRITNDVDSIGMNVSNSLSTFVSNMALFFGSIVMMFVTNWIMAFTAIFASVFGFIISFLLLKKSQKYFVQRQEELGNLNGHIEEIYSGHNVVKTYNGEKQALEEFDRINEKLYTCNQKSQFLSGIMQPIMGFIGNFGYVAVCVVGALLVMNGKTSFGTIVAFMIYIRLFTNPLSQIAQSMTGLQSTAAAAERVFEFMDEQELLNESKLVNYLDPQTINGNIEFKNVNFSYDGKREIIKNFNAKVSAGEKIAIVGPTGAGKTTMVNLLMKFYDISSGDILIDGVSIKSLTRENIHDLFVMVLQDTWLFDGSIEENIRFNKNNVTEEAVWQACKVVGIDHFIKTLPNALKSNVGDNESISSGQKQLITIARGMIENSPFLILDEATSNVELVQKAMDKITKKKTSFIIAHRLSTIKNADLILVMNNGNIVEQGKHEELLKQNGFYASLYNSQFEHLS